jgi:hypothetical protein
MTNWEGCERKWKEVAVTYFKVPSQNFPGGTEKNHKKPVKTVDLQVEEMINMTGYRYTAYTIYLHRKFYSTFNCMCVFLYQYFEFVFELYVCMHVYNVCAYVCIHQYQYVTVVSLKI